MIANNGQNIFDACLQGYGDLELLFNFIQDNDLTVNTELQAGQELIFNPSLGKIDIKEYVKVNNLELNNRTYDNDIEVTETLAIQWPVFVDPSEIVYPYKLIAP